MASGRRQGPEQGDSEPSGATEPITLTDPDGAVTRVAPWSTWTREQVRAPGGEPALVTRLDSGQLWFSAGRRRSPWRHEIHVGPAVVSTPRGRFQAIAEPDGGATIACLAGRTRVVAGLREPVLLGPDQSAAVSSDGRTLVVMDRVSGVPVPEPEVEIDLTDAALAAPIDDEVVAEPAEVDEVALAGVAAVEVGSRTPGPRLTRGALPLLGGEPGDDAPVPGRPTEDEAAPHARLGWIPELVAVMALLTLIVAAVWVFGQDGADGSGETALAPVTTAPITGTTPSTEAPTTEAPTTETTTAPTTAVPTTTTTEAPPAASSSTAVGELTSCRRAEGGVLATVAVTHRSGPASRFRVEVALVDAAGDAFAEGVATSASIAPGTTAPVDVLVPVEGEASGACELLGVAGVA